VKKLFNSPLKTVGFLTILIAVASFVIGGYFIFLGFYILGTGFIIYLVNFLVSRFIKDRSNVPSNPIAAIPAFSDK
jgi:hypothetical protein